MMKFSPIEKEQMDLLQLKRLSVWSDSGDPVEDFRLFDVTAVNKLTSEEFLEIADNILKLPELVEAGEELVRELEELGYESKVLSKLKTILLTKKIINYY